MALSSTTVKFLIMGVLSLGWLGWYRHVMRLNSIQTFHLAALQRDRRKARFYFLSVWVGLGAALLCFMMLEALATSTFDSSLTRDWVLGVLRGVGIWGLLIAGMVWSQVGQRVNQPNSDGKSLLPALEEKMPYQDSERPDDRRLR